MCINKSKMEIERVESRMIASVATYHYSERFASGDRCMNHVGGQRQSPATHWQEEECQLFDPEASHVAWAVLNYIHRRGPSLIHVLLSLFLLFLSWLVRLVDRTIERKNSSDETKIVKIGNWCKKCVRFYRMTFYRPLLFLPLPYRLFSSVENQWKAHAQPDEFELNSQLRISSDLIVYIKLEASSSKNIRTILYRELDFTNSLNY